MPAPKIRHIKLCDAKLESDDGHVFEVHRIVLARKSDYFRAMFCGIDKDRREFSVPGMSGSCLGEILNYIYTGEVSVTEQNLADLMEAADYILLEDLYWQIKQRYRNCITIANCLRVFTIAYYINDEDVSRNSFRFIELKFEDVIRVQKKGLEELPLEVLEKILSSGSLRVYSEATVWLSIVEWVQEDVSARSQCVPRLLMSLAGKELDEYLATVILQHEIVAKNTFMKDLNELKESPEFASQSDALIQFLGSRTTFFDHCYRIPPRLHVITSYDKTNQNFLTNTEGEFKLYTTYDENFDLWCEIGGGLNFHPYNLIAAGHSVYLFSDRTCRRFNLITQQWTPMANFRKDYYYLQVVELNGYLYLLGNPMADQWTLDMEVYDTANGRWFDGVSVSNTHLGEPVVINRKIYVVGSTENLNGMTTQEFDTVTHSWTPLPPPTVRRIFPALVAYREKVYSIGGLNNIIMCQEVSNVEVFDPKISMWRELPPLRMPYTWIKAAVLNDQIFLYDDIRERNTSILVWNDAEESWDQLEATGPLRHIENHRFSTVYDVDAIQSTMKGNRDPKSSLVESLCK